MSRAQEITMALKGRWYGQYGYVRCVAHEDGRPSLRLRDGEGGRVLVHCHAGCDATLILDRLRGSRVLGGPPINDTERRAADDRQRVLDSQRETSRIDRAKAIWRACSGITGTSAATYLYNRGISAPYAASLRHASALTHPDTNAVFDGLVAAVQAPSGAFVGVHRTYITCQGYKAGIEPNKLSLGAISGGAVRLAPAGPVLAVGEGIETALSYMQLTSVPAWAALSTSGLRAFVVPAGVAYLHILVDNDENGAGERAAAALAQRCAGALFKPSPVGKDWNDALRGAPAR